MSECYNDICTPEKRSNCDSRGTCYDFIAHKPDPNESTSSPPGWPCPYCKKDQKAQKRYVNHVAMEHGD